MKKLIPFLLTLTTFLANAQYNRNLTATPNNMLSVSRTSTLDVTGTSTRQKLPYFLRLPVTAPPSLTNLNDPLNPTPAPPLAQSPVIRQNSTWLKPWTPPSIGNGRFQSIQSFDMQRNISDSKATYQFTKRQK